MPRKSLLVILGAVIVIAVVVFGYFKIADDSQLAAVGGRGRGGGGSNSCVYAAPTITITPSSNSGYATQPIPYSLTLTNNNSSDCGTGSFFISAHPWYQPTGWFYGSGGYRTVDPGASHTDNIYITPPAGTAPGVRGFFYTAIDQQNSTSFGESAQMNHTILSPTTDSGAPTAPGNLTVLGTSFDRIFITWDPATDAETGISGYAIYSNGSLARAIPANPNSYVIHVNDPEPNMTFNLTLKAIDYNGNYSIDSNTAVAVTTASPDSTAPTAPTNVSVTNTTDTTATISWNPSTDDNVMYSYAVYPPTNSNLYGTGAGFCSVLAPGTSCTIGGLSPNTRYRISVTAYDLNYNEATSANLGFRTTQ